MGTTGLVPGFAFDRDRSSDPAGRLWTPIAERFVALVRRNVGRRVQKSQGRIHVAPLGAPSHRSFSIRHTARREEPSQSATIHDSPSRPSIRPPLVSMAKRTRSAVRSMPSFSFMRVEVLAMVL